MQMQTEAAAARDTNTMRLEIKAAAERDANSDLDELLLFGADVLSDTFGPNAPRNVCIGCAVGWLVGIAVGTWIDDSPSEGGLSSFGLVGYNDTQMIAMLIGCGVGSLVPLIWMSNNQLGPLPSERFIGKSPEYIQFYTNAYRAKTRSLQKKK